MFAKSSKHSNQPGGSKKRSHDPELHIFDKDLIKNVIGNRLVKIYLEVHFNFLLLSLTPVKRASKLRPCGAD